jgi:AcrR family transcriptional regulator
MNSDDRSPSAFDAMIGLLWGGPKPRSRGPKPAHTLDDLLDTAIALADKEGLEAVSMQRVAEQMHFTKMAVYRYVPGRPELVALMTDRALGLPPGDMLAGTWRSRIEAWALAVFEVFLRHPWGVQATMGPRVIGPNETAWMELGLAGLAESGLSGGERLDVLGVTAGHLRSIAQLAAAWGGGAERLESETNSAFAVMLRGREAHYPELARAISESRNLSGENNGLTFGLNCIFDGIEARLARRQAKSQADFRSEDS